MRGATVPAVLFLEASRGAGPLDGLGMLFFDPAEESVDDEAIAQLAIDVEDEIRLAGGGEVSSSRVGLADFENG